MQYQTTDPKLTEIYEQHLREIMAQGREHEQDLCSEAPEPWTNAREGKDEAGY